MNSPGHSRPCDYLRPDAQLRTGAVESFSPPAPPALVRQEDSESGMTDRPIFHELLAWTLRGRTSECVQ